MSTCTAAERKFLSREELEIVALTHYPRLAEVDADALRDAQSRLRDLRDKSRTIAGHKRREARGKASPRAVGASGNAEHAARRKQIFAQALKRTNRQLQRLNHAEAVSRTVAGQQRALAMLRRSQRPQRPGAERHAHPGMRENPSLRRAVGVNPAKVGRVSQAGKAAQAKRDSN